MQKPKKDYDNYHDNRSDKIKYVPKDWATSPFDLLGSAENLDSVSLRGDLLRTAINSCSPLGPAQPTQCFPQSAESYEDRQTRDNQSESQIRIDFASSNQQIENQDINHFAGLFSDREDLQILLEQSQIRLILKFTARDRSWTRSRAYTSVQLAIILRTEV